MHKTAKLIIGTGTGLVILLGVLYGIFVARTPDQYSGYLKPKPSLLSLTVEHPNLVVRGTGLQSVEIWAAPTSTEPLKDAYVRWGIAQRVPSASDVQVWTMLIPRDPQLVTEIYARAEDEDAHEVGTISLPITGARDLSAILWPKPESEPIDHASATSTVTLKVGENRAVGDLRLTVTRLTQDSRCPSDVQCIQAGRVETEIELQVGSQTKTIRLASDRPAMEFAGYAIRVAEVQPAAKSGTSISTADYRITYEVVAPPSGGSQDYEITEADNGKRFEYPVTTRFSVILNQRMYPQDMLTCTPQSVVRAIEQTPVVAAPMYASRFEVVQKGSCQLASDDFSVTITGL